jgi:formylmethanofuran--tetrahydromethanopterin N-formyltransferase
LSESQRQADLHRANKGIRVKIENTFIVDTFAEGFGLRVARVVVTAHDRFWLEAASRSVTGYGTSVIGCDAEVGVERWIPESETMDGRVGVSLLACGFSAELLGKAVANRVAQCLLTAPTVSIFDGLPDAEVRSPLGSHIRFFGDGFEKTKVIDSRRYWRIPVMDGECVMEETFGIIKGVGGGNFILQADSIEHALDAARRAVDAISKSSGTITPFPGGVVRSGSKVGSKYDGLKASTNHAFCPGLVGRVQSELADGVAAALEIVVDGIDEESVVRSLVAGIRSAAGPGVIAISAGNYGGKLGKYHFHLHQILKAASASA